MDTPALDRRFLVGALTGAAGIAAMARVAKGGPLSPPAGPVASTSKTLQELYDRVARTDAGLAEPRIPVQSLPGSATGQYVISQPGSYYLTDSIQGVPGKNAIEVNADNVSVDLCGYSIIGVEGPNGSGDAIAGQPGRAGLAVCNGHIASWARNGVNAQQVFGCFFQNLTVRRTGFGIGGGSLVAGDGSAIINCLCRTTNGRAVAAGNRSLVSNCISNEASAGFFVQASAMFVDCAAYSCSDIGFAVENAGTVDRCIAVGCNRGAFSFGNEANVTNSQFIASGLAAVHITGGLRHRIEGNVISQGPTGILIASPATRCFVAGNRVSGATTAYSIAAGNSFGPIVDVSGVGNFSAVPNASHPWANFVY